MNFNITNLVFEGEGPFWDYVKELDFSEDIPVLYGLNCYCDRSQPNKVYQKPDTVFRFKSGGENFSNEELSNILKFILKATVADEYPYLSLKELGIEDMEIKIISCDYCKDM